MLAVTELQVAYGGLRVLHDVSLAVGEAELVALLGPNGAGKTTTLRAIAGLASFEGSIELEGRSLAKVPPHKIVRMGASFAQEGKRVFAHMSVRENLMLGGHIHRGNKAQYRQDLEECLTLFPVLERKLGEEAGTLSGGEQQMLVIAQALMAHPRLLLIDEPSQGLAPLLADEVFAALGALRERGTSILLAEQLLDKVLPICDRAYVLHLGRVAVMGAPEDVAASPELRRVYIGSAR